MILKATLNNKAHPEYGQATVPFPIPDSEYDHTIGLLEDMDIGSSTAQDCRVGKGHSLNINGGTMPMEEYDRLEGRNVALDLILNRAGTITPYGVVYDNGMKLEQVYDGRHFPEYHYEPCVASVALSRPGQDGREMLYFTVINGISTAEEGGKFRDRGYVAYKGTQPEIKEILGRHIQLQHEIGAVRFANAVGGNQAEDGNAPCKRSIEPHLPNWQCELPCPQS